MKGKYLSLIAILFLAILLFLSLVHTDGFVSPTVDVTMTDNNGMPVKGLPIIFIEHFPKAKADSIPDKFIKKRFEEGDDVSITDSNGRVLIRAHFSISKHFFKIGIINIPFGTHVHSDGLLVAQLSDGAYEAFPIEKEEHEKEILRGDLAIAFTIKQP